MSSHGDVLASELTHSTMAKKTELLDYTPYMKSAQQISIAVCHLPAYYVLAWELQSWVLSRNPESKVEFSVMQV